MRSCPQCILFIGIGFFLGTSFSLSRRSASRHDLVFIPRAPDNIRHPTAAFFIPRENYPQHFSYHFSFAAGFCSVFGISKCSFAKINVSVRISIAECDDAPEVPTPLLPIRIRTAKTIFHLEIHKNCDRKAKEETLTQQMSRNLPINI